MILKVAGDQNTAVGTNAGGNLTSGSNNLFLGNGANYISGPASHKLVIETEVGNTNFQLISGDFATNDLRFNGGVVINNVSTIASPLYQKSGLRFTGLTPANSLTNTTAPFNNKFLSVNSTGDVILQNLPAASSYTDTNIYTNNGTLTGTRTLTMGNNNLIFSSNGSTSGNGRIYIGNTTLFPAITATSNYRLLVEGGILTEKVKVALRNPTTNWADYVFADNYNLMPLKEVEAYIKENKHLPGISSADTLVKEGLDLADMQAKQMEKIEELTLHAIKQNKQLEKQSKEIETLKEQVRLLLSKSN